MNDETQESTSAPAASSAAPSITTPPAPAPVKRELRNSLWCYDSSGRLGMIAEINSGLAMFFYESQAGGLEDSPVFVGLDQLAQARAADLPARLGYTAQQLIDLGYE